MVELDDVRYLFEALLKLLNLMPTSLSGGAKKWGRHSRSDLLEMSTELDHRRYAKHPVFIHD
jgi:hypothetical protein